MMRLIVLLFATLSAAVFVACSTVSYGRIDGWMRAGTYVADYDTGLDVGAGPDATNAATIKCRNIKTKGWGELMQKCRADQYRGKRVRLSAMARTSGVKHRAILWMRVDSTDGHTWIAHDNMYHRPIVGTTSWTRYEIVLDVPEGAGALAYGGSLLGQGQLWFTSVQLDVVDSSVPSTDDHVRTLEDSPTNLDFH